MTSILSDDDFSHIVRLVPPVSVDLIIRDTNGNVLAALRTNEPAKGASVSIANNKVHRNEWR